VPHLTVPTTPPATSTSNVPNVSGCAAARRGSRSYIIYQVASRSAASDRPHHPTARRAGTSYSRHRCREGSHEKGRAAPSLWRMFRSHGVDGTPEADGTRSGTSCGRRGPHSLEWILLQRQCSRRDRGHQRVSGSPTPGPLVFPAFCRLHGTFPARERDDRDGRSPLNGPGFHQTKARPAQASTSFRTCRRQTTRSTAHCCLRQRSVVGQIMSRSPHELRDPISRRSDLAVD